MSVWTELMGLEFAQRFYDVGGVRTRVLEAGSGMPLIFLHGTGGHAEAYGRNIAAHARHFRVMAVDMVGHGYTDAPDLDYQVPDYVGHLGALIDVIGAEKVALSGESLGAMVAAWYASTHPDRVEKLVLNTGMLISRTEQGKQQLRDGLQRSQQAAGALTRDSVRQRLAWLMADPESSITDELVDIRFKIYAQPGRAPILKKIAGNIMGGLLDDAWSEQWSNPATLRGIQCPTLVVWSRHNPGLDVERAALAMREIPRAEMVVLEDCAHWPQWEQANAFNAAHLAFLIGDRSATSDPAATVAAA